MNSRSAKPRSGFDADHFLWGTATAAHQVEGGNIHSDWWDWEQLPGKIKNGERSGDACDHWNRFGEDLDLMRELGVNAYRFSVEWAKVEPRLGEIDRGAVDHYRKVVLLLLDAGIEPIITLHHFTSPKWFAEKGGWEWTRAPGNPVGDAAAAAFGGYAKLVYREIAPEATLWCTVNEPLVHLGGGYVMGVTPPQKSSFAALRAPLIGLLRSHAEAYRVLHECARLAGRTIQVGMAHHLRVFEPKRKWNPIDHDVARRMDAAVNTSIPDALESGRIRLRIPGLVDIDEGISGLAGTQDFFGLNYYTRDLVTLGLKNGRIEPVQSTVPGSPKNDLGWELYPEGFLRVLGDIHARYPERPILVTENGLADHDDSRRPKFIRDHLEVLERAIAAGIPVFGYCHWSLLDNFEWIEGFEPRFGLVEIDYATLARKPRASFYAYRDAILASRALRIPATPIT